MDVTSYCKGLGSGRRLLMKTVFVVGLMSFLVISSGAAKTTYVPDDYPAIQLAINASNDGDAIIVRPDSYNVGPYRENIDFLGKAIIVKSEKGPEETTIEGSYQYSPVVIFWNGEGLDSILDGFTIKDGGGFWKVTPYNMLGYGGGIYCSNSSPTIINNIICDNHLAWSESAADSRQVILSYGGGIYLEGSTAELANNVFLENSAKYGGGICIYNAPDVLIGVLNCTIRLNHADTCGGIAGSDSSCMIINTIVWENLPEYEQVNYGAPKEVNYSDIQEGWTGPGEANIDEDPQFIDEYHIASSSPCIDVGDNNPDNGNNYELPLEDIDNNARIVWWNCTEQFYPVVDMGADEVFEVIYNLYVTGNLRPGGHFVANLVGSPGTMPVILLIGSEIIETPLNTNWGAFYLQWPLIVIDLGSIPEQGIQKIAGPVPLSPAAPYDLPIQALIGLYPDSLTNLWVFKVR